MTSINDADHPRHVYYVGSSIKGVRPKSVIPADHTMKEPAFLEYIGTADPSAHKIETKKFSPSQSRALEAAYQQLKPVRIIGAPREDIQYIARLHNRTVVPGSLLHHDRSNDRNSNSHRHVMCVTRTNSGDERTDELWVFVFPSKQYVDQIGELIQAIFDRFNQTGAPQSRQSHEVGIVHFENLEKDIVEWTGFSDNAKKFIRFGEVAVIGNLDVMLPGIKAAGFSEQDGWHFFGLSNMFRVLRCVDPSAKKQIILFGFTESFWGEASGHYVDALIRCGTRHILYGSKAGNLANPKHIHKVMAPNAFCTLTDEKGAGEGAPPREHAHGLSIGLELMMGACSIIDSGTCVTVNTVIGEDERERGKYDDLQPALIDCENWHIAKAVRTHNRTVNALGFQHLKEDVIFVPVHFITDYIHSGKEKPRKNSSHLASDPSHPQYATKRREGFKRIGFFFGIYAHRFGLRDNMDIQLKGVQLQGVQPRRAPASIHDPIGMPPIDFGAARLRVEFIQRNWRNRLIPFQELAALCKISQTHGYSRLFLRAYQIINSARQSIAKEDLMLFDLLHLKLLIQKGAWISAAQQWKSIETEDSWMSHLNFHSQLGAYERRKLLLAAHASQPVPIPLELRVVGDDIPYQRAANGLFAQIASLFAAMTVESLLELSDRLTRLRKEYYLDTEAAEESGIRYEKSAIALLYLEAAAYLKWGSHDSYERVIRLLYIAHILNGIVGGNEVSELNGEILNACTEPAHRSILALAMRRDEDAAVRMRDFVAEHHFSWADAVARGALQSLSLTPTARGEAITELMR